LTAFKLFMAVLIRDLWSAAGCLGDYLRTNASEV
jgi:hypothetical protein